MPGEEGWRSFWPRRRIRRPADVAELALGAVALAALALLAARAPASATAADAVLPAISATFARDVLSVANVIASLAVLGTLLAVAGHVVRARHFGLVSGVLAAAVGPLAGLGIAALTGLAAGPAAVPLLLGPVHGAAGLPVTAATAFLAGTDLHRRRLLRPARLAIAGAVACGLLLGSLSVVAAAYALVVGATAGVAVRVAAGVLPARPPEERIVAVLVRAGRHVGPLRLLEEGPGRVRYASTDADGSELRITVVDPDRRGVAFARRLWRTSRLRTAAVGRPAATLRGQLEREALTAALADAAGVAAPDVLALVAAGPALVLAERPVAGSPLTDDVGRVPEVWVALRRLHDAGLAHGALTADDVVLLPDGGAGFADLPAAQPAATELQRELDVAALLVATAPLLGAPEAVAAMRNAYGTGPTAEARLAALLQPSALPRPTGRAVRGTPVLGELRQALAGPEGARAPVTSAPRLERLRPRTVIAVAGATLAVHILATQLSAVSIGNALRHAQVGWFAVALAGSAITYLGSALALIAFVPAALKLARTTLVQLASSFLTLVTPPAVGHVGLNIRYLQRSGLPVAVATGAVAVKETVTVVVTVPVLLLCGWLSGVSASRLTLLPEGGVLAVLLVAACALGLVVAIPGPRRLLRNRLEPLVRRTLPQLIAAIGRPRRMVTALLGVLLLDAGYVLALGASLQAFGASLALPALVVVYLAASALGSAAPTPGGLGAVEAALVGGLTATGVPLAPALTAVLLFRAATFWLPAPLGWVAFVFLQRRGEI